MRNKTEELKREYRFENGLRNSIAEPTIDYVSWLEKKVIRRNEYAQQKSIEFLNSFS